ncbi:MAG: helix-turn-helix domain-containing protein [Enterococcus sp.]|uniref:helix-turn-helix domain-containing protein n=1 Tax=Enterococcus TaxID=1350 RepID=UPI0009BDABEC|nr:helix-turn-helix domain-containing protein [Enterococcus casseliflavus]OQO86025.1 XRE family transcriptional regulator [Enterococcus casseliflavus]
MSIGKRIAELRKQKNMSQLELAKALNVAPSTIGMWETDQRAMKDDSIRQLSKYFGVSTDYILNGNETKTDPNLLVATHVDDDLTEKQKQEVQDFIEFIKMRDHNKK